MKDDGGEEQSETQKPPAAMFCEFSSKFEQEFFPSSPSSTFTEQTNTMSTPLWLSLGAQARFGEREKPPFKVSTHQNMFRGIFYF